MSMRIGTLLITAMVLATACERIDSDESAGICGNVGANHVCAVPFEAVFSNRQAFMDRNVRLDGVLVVGVRPEPPGSQTPVMLLFPSIERARICNPEFAIELMASSGDVADELRSAGGRFVSVAGRMQPSSKGHWSQMEITTPPALINGEKINSQCMATPPPPPPEP